MHVRVGTFLLSNTGEQELPALNFCWEAAGPKKLPMEAKTH